MSELRGLAAQNEAFRGVGVKLVGISSDSETAAARVVEKQRLPFSILSDETCSAIAAFGLLHPHEGPNHSDISLPAQVLIGRDGRILWSRVARLIQDRPSPDETLQHVREALSPSR